MHSRRWGMASAMVLLGGAVLGAAVPAAAVGTAAGATASVTACPTGWGSLPKSVSATAYGDPLTDIRSGTHECYDRLVFDVPGGGTSVGYQVSYVSKLIQDASGETIPVSGGAILEIRLSAPSYDPNTGAPTYPGVSGQPLPGITLTGYPTFRDTRFGSSFEGVTQVGLGVRARLPFRVLQLSDRVVVDVAHTW